MRFPRRWPAVLTFTIVLGGCAHTPPSTPDDRVRTALASLGATPETSYQQKIFGTDTITNQLRIQTIVLVPSKDGKTYQIVDSEGEIFSDYYDFLRDNTLPR